MITAATSRGFDTIGTWPELSVTTVAPMRFAAARSYSGGTMRSLTTMNHEGRVFHAAVVTFSARNVEFQSPCVAYARSRSAGVASGRKSRSRPSRVSVR
jgi:hypothetical protein